MSDHKNTTLAVHWIVLSISIHLASHFNIGVDSLTSSLVYDLEVFQGSNQLIYVRIAVIVRPSKSDFIELCNIIPIFDFNLLLTLATYPPRVASSLSSFNTLEYVLTRLSMKRITLTTVPK
jgi:hypothetical protein